MGYYGYGWTVEKCVEADGEEHWDVVERSADANVVCVDSTWSNEVDARAAAYFNEAMAKHNNMDIAALALGKYLEKNGLVPVNLNVAYFDKKTGKVNFTLAIQRIWERL